MKKPKVQEQLPWTLLGLDFVICGIWFGARIEHDKKAGWLFSVNAEKEPLQ